MVSDVTVNWFFWGAKLNENSNENSLFKLNSDLTISEYFEWYLILNDNILDNKKNHVILFKNGSKPKDYNSMIIVDLITWEQVSCLWDLENKINWIKERDIMGVSEVTVWNHRLIKIDTYQFWTYYTDMKLNPIYRPDAPQWKLNNISRTINTLQTQSIRKIDNWFLIEINKEKDNVKSFYLNSAIIEVKDLWNDKIDIWWKVFNKTVASKQLGWFGKLS
jgi:hypothetical protein